MCSKIAFIYLNNDNRLKKLALNYVLDSKKGKKILFKLICPAELENKRKKD